MATKYLDNIGLAYFWDKLKSWVTSRGYITSSDSITGNAATATKLATARSISAGDLEFQGSANFDGSGNISLNVTHHKSIVSIGNKNNYPYHRIAYMPVQTSSYITKAITFLVSRDTRDSGYGICRILFRTENVSSNQTAFCSVQWLARTTNIPVDVIQVGFNNTSGASYADIFYKSYGVYANCIFRVLAHTISSNTAGRGYTLIERSLEVDNTTTSDPKTSIESYVSIAAAGTNLHEQAYTSIITAVDMGIVESAATATKLETARTINGVSFDGSDNITVEDSTKVSKSGDTMTGDLEVSKISPHINLRNTALIRGTGPEDNINQVEILGKDYNNKALWGLYHNYLTDRTHRIRLICYNGLTTDSQYAEIGVGYDSNGNPFTNAPTPAAGDNSTKIATTAFVKTKCDGYLLLIGGTLTGALSERASNVNISVEPSSSKEDWRFLITRSTADTTHTGNLMRLGVTQQSGTKDYRVLLGVSNPRQGNLPNAESIANGYDDPDANTGSCWGSIGIFYDYSKNKAYAVLAGSAIADYEYSDSSTAHIPTTSWVRKATGNFACNAATASSVPWSGVTSKPTTISGYGITDAAKKPTKMKTTVSSTVAENTAFTVATHTLNSDYLLVFINGVQCDYTDYSTTQVKFSFKLNVGDVVLSISFG